MSIDTITEDTIPDTIREIEQWICWREKDRDGKTTKIPTKPYRTSGSPNAKTDDPSHWRDFDTALNYHRSGRITTSGVGFVFSTETEIVGVDLDSCRDPETGEFDDWAQDVIDRLDSFTEVSPSGTGAHILLKGKLPDGRNRRGDIEMYDEGRFFTVTGEHVDGTPLEIKHRQDSIVGVHRDYVQTDPGDDGLDQLGESSTTSTPTDGNQTDSGQSIRTPPSAKVERRPKQSDIRKRFDEELPPIDDPALEIALQGLPPQKVPVPVPQSLGDLAGPGVPFDDIEVIEKAYNSKSGDKIQALYCGEASLYNTADSEYPSQSEADMALLFYLGFWTGKDPEQMERLFRDSGLYREKWDDQHYGNGATYGGVCLAKTLLELTDYYEPPESETSSRGGERPHTSSGHSTSSPAAENGRHHPPPPESQVGYSPSSRDQGHGEAASEGAPASSQQESWSGSGWHSEEQVSPAVPSHSPTQTERGHSHFREVSIDIGAVEDARRLALKVTQQHEQLTAQAAHIADLENRLYWYRQAFGVEPPVPPDRDGGENALIGNSETEDLAEIDPSGEPAPAPADGDTASESDEKTEETSQSSNHAPSQADEQGSERTISDADAEPELRGSDEFETDLDSAGSPSSSMSALFDRLRRFIP